MYLRNTEDLNCRGRPLIRWKERVKEYLNERGTSRSTGRGGKTWTSIKGVSIGRGGGSSAVCIPFGGAPRENETSETVERYLDRQMQCHLVEFTSKGTSSTSTSNFSVDLWLQTQMYCTSMVMLTNKLLITSRQVSIRKYFENEIHCGELLLK